MSASRPYCGTRSAKFQGKEDVDDGSESSIGTTGAALKRLAGAYAWQSFLKAGSIIPGGSDAPVERGEPMIEFYAAVARKSIKGESGEGCRAGTSEPSNTDAWFAAFAPASSPRVAVCVMLVKDGAGGETAAPVAREVLEAALQASR